MTARTVLTIAALTLQEAARRRVLRSLAVLTVVLLGAQRLGVLPASTRSSAALTSGEARLAASTVLNLVMFGLSLIAALGTAFLAGPTLAGEIESGIALAVLARPVRRSAVLVGKWLGLVAFGSGFVAVAGLAQLLIVRATVGYWPPQPVTGLALLARADDGAAHPGPAAVHRRSRRWRRASWRSACSAPPGSRAWSASVGEALGNDGVARVGTVSRMLLPTDGLWRGAMHAFQDPALLAQFGAGVRGLPVPERGPAHRRLPRLGRPLDRPRARARRRWPSSAATCEPADSRARARLLHELVGTRTTRSTRRALELGREAGAGRRRAGDAEDRDRRRRDVAVGVEAEAAEDAVTARGSREARAGPRRASRPSARSPP